MGMYIVQIFMGDKRRKIMAKIKDTKDEVSSTFEARQNVKTPEDDNQKKSTSLLKKSDLSVIFIGAGIITVIVFFMLFRPDKDNTSGKISIDAPQETVDLQSLEERIKNLEALVPKEGDGDRITTESTPSLDSYKARVERVEEALSMKFDLVATRLSVLENKIEGFDRQLELSGKAAGAAKQVAAKTVPVKKATAKSVKSISKPVQKSASNSTPKGSTIHKVKKGETLYGISKRYKTTVTKLRALNNLTDKAGIFPGDDLVVR